MLHKLCRVLNELGAEALIWPTKKPEPSRPLNLRYLEKSLRWYIRQAETLIKYVINYKNFRASPGCKIARKRDINDSIVVYPEIVDGNPLGAAHVVRWFLNKPGALTGKTNYGEGELYFYFDKHFDAPDINPHPENHLNVIDLLEGIYHDVGNQHRVGSCYMVRKGMNRVLDQHSADAICVDGLGHREMAKVFNRCKYFISYDLYTMYSVYAALCGCIPVIIPKEGVSMEAWHSLEENRYGLAYGWDEIPWALNTRDKLVNHLRDTEKRSIDSIKRFIDITQKHFSS